MTSLPASAWPAEADAPLDKLTWFRLGGAARYLARPCDEVELAVLLRRACEENLPVKILGGGANVLVSDAGFNGLVLRLDQPAFREVEVEGEHVSAGAGADLMPLCRRMVQEGLAGLEGMAGIPGTVGGAIRMNAGGRFGEFADVVESVRLMNRDGTVDEWPRQRVNFGYRHADLGDRIVLGARLALSKDDPVAIRSRYDEYWRLKMTSQPMADKSAGCIFKNPPGESAGRLIDQAGLKGTAVGAARVSDRHANFIVADQGATADDVISLIDLIRRTVHNKWGTELEVEVDIW